MITKLKPLTEKQIESQILEWLNYQKGIFAFKVNTVGVFDPKKEVFRVNRNPFLHLGTADILGICDGRFFAMEVKTPLGLKRALSKPTPHDIRQQQFIHTVKRFYGFGGLVCSINDAAALIHQIRSLPLLKSSSSLPLRPEVNAGIIRKSNSP